MLLPEALIYGAQDPPRCKIVLLPPFLHGILSRFTYPSGCIYEHSRGVNVVQPPGSVVITNDTAISLGETIGITAYGQSHKLYSI